MTRIPTHHNRLHITHRMGWLRAATLGANDGVISIASLLVGMAAANTPAATLLLSGVAALVAGALSMAAGEYVSVSSQADAEKAELDMEAKHLAQHPEFELNELTQIYKDRGLSDTLAAEVAQTLMKHNALQAHARDELGLTEELAAKPFEAAWSSALSFCAGGALPMLVVLLGVWLGWNGQPMVAALAGSALAALAATGYTVARLSNAPPWVSVGRITAWGCGAMLVSAAVGAAFGVSMH